MQRERKEKILVVDDEEIIRMGCQRILEDSEYEVELAENGRIGIEKIKSDSFDLVLVDLMMPEMGGMKLLEELRNYDESIIPIIITGFATVETAVDAVKKGAYDYLPKPFTPDELRAKINRGLEKRHLILQAKTLREEVDRNLLEVSKHKSQILTIINCMSEGVIATNRMGQIVLINPAALKMLRLKGREIIGHTIRGLLGSVALEQTIEETLEKVTKTNTSISLEIDTQDGRVLQPKITPIIDEKGECLGTVTVLSNITEEKKIEKMQANFVSLVSHELKAPVGAIEGYLDLILDGVTGGDAQKEKEILQKSRDRAAALLELINDLLDLSRTDRKKSLKVMAPVNVNSMLSDLADFYKNEAKSKSISVSLELSADNPSIRGNLEDLSRLFANLINNAIKYTPPNGHVGISVKKQNRQVVIEVKDTGIGLSEEDRTKIFDQFYRAQSALEQKITGTGLGLSIAKKIAEDHQGYIEVESELGKGSVFYVYLSGLIE